MLTEFGLIRNLKEDDQKSKELQKKYQELWTAETTVNNGGLVQLRFKRDSGKQKRIQAAIPRRHIEQFLSHFEEVDPAKW